MSKAFTREDDAAPPPLVARRPASGPRLLTPEGHARLLAERDGLADAPGDGAEARRRELDAILERAVVSSPDAGADGRAVLGAWVEVADGAGRRWLRLVGADEADAAGGLVRVDSPLGAALLGRRAGDAVTVERPRDLLELRVVSVQSTAQRGT